MKIDLPKPPPPDFEEFLQAQLKEVAASLGIPAEFLKGTKFYSCAPRLIDPLQPLRCRHGICPDGETGACLPWIARLQEERRRRHRRRARLRRT